MSTEIERLERKRRATLEIPYPIKNEELTEFKTICEIYRGKASLIPIQPPPEPTTEETKRELTPSRHIVARHVGLTAPPPTRIRSYAQFIDMGRNEKIDLCSRIMYPLQSAPQMKDRDTLLKLHLEALLEAWKIGREAETGREPKEIPPDVEAELIREAFIRACSTRLRQYYTIMATPELLLYMPPVAPDTTEAKLLYCETPETLQYTVDRDTTLKLTSEICRKTYMFPYIIKSNEISPIARTLTTEVTRYINPELPIPGYMDEIIIEMTIPGRPKLAENKKDKLLEYLKKHKPQLLRQVRRAKNLEQIAIEIYKENIERKITTLIDTTCYTTPPPLRTHIVDFSKEAEVIKQVIPEFLLKKHEYLIDIMKKTRAEAIIPAGIPLQPICRPTVDVSIEKHTETPELITTTVEAEAEVVGEVKAIEYYTTNVKIRACVNTCTLLECILDIMRDYTIAAIMRETRETLNFIEFER